jgi:branched-chain amino acid transport system substrate-binding protein
MTNLFPSRRSFSKNIATLSGAVIAAATPLRYALGAMPLRVGLVLPYSGVYSKFGEGITDGFEYALKLQGGQFGGRPVEIVKADDQLDAKVGGEVTQRLITRDKVDVIIGPVGSNVAPVVHRICTKEGIPLIIPTAASNDLTRARCHPLVFRVSHSHWQSTNPMAAWMAAKGQKRIITFGMNYAAGKEGIGGFVEGLASAGGQVVDQKWPGLQELDYQAYFADVSAARADAIFAWFAGANAVEFVKQYSQSGLKEKVPLVGVQYLTDSTLLAAQASAAEGVTTITYWTPTLDNEANRTFVSGFLAATGKPADLNSMHGFDSCMVLANALKTTKGDLRDQQKFSQAMQAVEFQSPRGPFRFSKARNPIMNFYSAQVKAGKLQITDLIKRNVEDPALDCKA